MEPEDAAILDQSPRDAIEVDGIGVRRIIPGERAALHSGQAAFYMETITSVWIVEDTVPHRAGSAIYVERAFGLSNVQEVRRHICIISRHSGRITCGIKSFGRPPDNEMGEMGRAGRSFKADASPTCAVAPADRHFAGSGSVDFEHPLDTNIAEFRHPHQDPRFHAQGKAGGNKEIAAQSVG